MTQTHWKRLVNPDYLGAYSLEPGQDKTITILTVSKEHVKGADGKDSECIVAKIKDEKPLILNKTNCKTITKMYGPYIEGWNGKRVTLYAAKVKAFGENTEALRIRAEEPKLPILTPQHPKWDDAKKAIEAGNVTIDQIRKSYQLSEANEKLLKP